MEGPHADGSTKESGGQPFRVESVRPIQMSTRDALDTFVNGRSHFTLDQWRELLLRSVGFAATLGMGTLRQIVAIVVALARKSVCGDDLLQRFCGGHVDGDRPHAGSFRR